jgi:hypothetical protein
MHMHMAHGPGGKVEETGETPDRPEPSNVQMNQMRPVQPPKRPGGRKHGPPPPRRRRR